jgi:hypothetical protein
VLVRRPAPPGIRPLFENKRPVPSQWMAQSTECLVPVIVSKIFVLCWVDGLKSIKKEGKVDELFGLSDLPNHGLLMCGLWPGFLPVTSSFALAHNSCTFSESTTTRASLKINSSARRKFNTHMT